jgi:alkanesulfonate monooxygenase SsuD/methylene tetrahydromethanopterin reductase-like flavin-dependent oxidoreductase (luciferase family)
MKFALTLYMERFSQDEAMTDAAARALELVRIADEGGFDAVFTAEHHTVELTISPNPFVTLAHWAAHTSNVRLGTAVVSAPYWHPIRLAGETALADVLSDGRMELGLGSGAYQYEFDRMGGGLERSKGGAYLREIVPAVKRLWTGDYEHKGELWSFPSATAVPKPLQQPHPPVWIAARDPHTFDFAIDNGCDVMTTALHKPFSEVESLKERFDAAVAMHPGTRRPRLMTQRRVCVYDDTDQWPVPVDAVLRYGRHFETLMQNLGGVHDGFAEPAALETISNREDYRPEALRENLIFGTPDEVITKLRMYEKLGFDYFTYGATFGLPHDVARRSLELFVSDVIPAFRDAS